MREGGSAYVERMDLPRNLRMTGEYRGGREGDGSWRE